MQTLFNFSLIIISYKTLKYMLTIKTSGGNRLITRPTATPAIIWESVCAANCVRRKVEAT